MIPTPIDFLCCVLLDQSTYTVLQYNNSNPIYQTRQKFIFLHILPLVYTHIMTMNKTFTQKSYGHSHASHLQN